MWLSEQHLILQFLVLRFFGGLIATLSFPSIVDNWDLFSMLAMWFLSINFYFSEKSCWQLWVGVSGGAQKYQKKIRVEDNLKIIYIFHSQTLQGKSCGDGKMHVLIFLGNWNWFYSQSLLRIIQKSLTTQFQFQEGYDFQYTYVNVYKDY